MIEVIPFLGAGVLILVGYVVFMRFKAPNKKVGLNVMDESPPKGNRAFVFYSGDEGIAFRGEVVHLEGYKEQISLQIDDEISGRIVELSNVNFKEHFQLMEHTTLLSGHITFACRVDANNRIFEWSNTNIEKFKQNYSNITMAKKESEAKKKLLEEIETATSIIQQKDRPQQAFFGSGGGLSSHDQE